MAKQLTEAERVGIQKVCDACREKNSGCPLPEPNYCLPREFLLLAQESETKPCCANCEYWAKLDASYGEPAYGKCLHLSYLSTKHDHACKRYLERGHRFDSEAQDNAQA